MSSAVAEEEYEELLLEDEDGSTGTAPAGFEFDKEFQEKILALSIRDTVFRRRVDGLIKPEYFEEGAHGVLFDVATRYYDRYGALPHAIAIWAQLIKDESRPGGSIRDDMLADVVGTLKDMLKADIGDRDYVADKIGAFAKNQAIARAMLESIDLLSKGKLDQIEGLLKKAFETGAHEDFKQIDYWNSIDGRTEYRKNKLAGLVAPRGIPTGIRKFDALLYHKGWGIGELSVLMGGAKKGKSMGLGEFALRSSKQGYNTLYATLEVSPEIIADRMDANTTVTKMSELDASIMDVHDKVKLQASGKVGALKIVEFPSGTLTPKALKRVLERYKSEGIKFDLIVVDYADIMAPDYRTTDAIENSKSVWLGLRAIAQMEDAAVLTATQTNRSGYTESTAKAEHAAEDFNKVRIADLLISINRDDDEKERGVARLYFAASRNQEGDFAIEIDQDLSTMRFITGVGKVVSSEKKAA